MAFDYSLSDPANTMKIDEDERSRDPQSTLPRYSRQSPATGRRLKLGTPKVTSSLATATPQEESAEAHPGFSLGKKQQVAESSSTNKPIVQPWIMMVAGGALVLLVVALILAPGGGGSAEGLANERLLAQYTKYLESKGASNGVDIAERRKEVVSRLQAVSWAKAIGDQATLESELTVLLFLDNDKSSPLYQYSVKQLKELGPGKKRAGL